jgi:hypothetical protein
MTAARGREAPTAPLAQFVVRIMKTPNLNLTAIYDDFTLPPLFAESPTS